MLLLFEGFLPLTKQKYPLTQKIMTYNLHALNHKKVLYALLIGLLVVALAAGYVAGNPSEYEGSFEIAPDKDGYTTTDDLTGGKDGIVDDPGAFIHDEVKGYTTTDDIRILPGDKLEEGIYGGMGNDDYTSTDDLHGAQDGMWSDNDLMPH